MRYPDHVNEAAIIRIMLEKISFRDWEFNISADDSSRLWWLVSVRPHPSPAAMRKVVDLVSLFIPEGGVMTANLLAMHIFESIKRNVHIDALYEMHIDGVPMVDHQPSGGTTPLTAALDAIALGPDTEKSH